MNSIRRRRRLLSANHRHHTDSGFTLIELLVVCTILPLIIGAISVALLSVFTLQSSVSNRLTGSTDAQTVTANFEKDVQSAASITTNSVPICGTGVQLLGLQWSANQLAGFQTAVSYIQISNGSSYSLVRQYCSSGPSSNPTSTSVISADIPVSQSVPIVAPATLNPNASRGWIPASSVTSVTFAITEPKSRYSYTLLAVPAVSGSTGSAINSSSGSSSGQASTVPAPTTTCNFATPNTGTYASTLCFLDFSSYLQPASSCATMVAAVNNFTLSFCLVVSGGPVAPTSLPSYGAAFLGNTLNGNSFYTGVAGEPALYQTSQANGTSTTVTITNIQVFGPNGAAATGWELVSGDAESTDSGEYITWSSDKSLSLLPNSPTSPIGNACGYTPAPSSSYPNAYLTGVGTTSVECQANGYETGSTKTGTVMLEAPAPTSVTVLMKGSGLQAIFLGLLLPG